MPPLETTERNQKIVLWQAVGRTNRGEVILDTPAELDARWEKGRTDMTMPTGATLTLEGMLVLDRSVAEGSIVWLGTLDEWYGTGSGNQSAQLYRVETYDEIPDLKARETRREAGLVRFRGSLP